jgi:hypothetical protein
VGVGAVNPVATRSYDQGLVLASRLTDRNIIGAGLEVIVARDHMAGPKYPVTKYATKVNGDARYWCDELARRQDKVKKVMGKFVIDTEYDTGHLWGRAKPSLVPMYQPFINIVDEDGHNAPDMADQRGEFRELADKVASDHGYYFDVIEGHGNLVVHLDAGVRQLAVADMVVMSKADEVRPFVSFKPNPEEWASWLRSVHP